MGNDVRKSPTRDQLLAAPVALRREWVAIPEWPNGGVFVSEISGHDRDQLEEREYNRRKANPETALTNFRARLLVHAIVDDSGARLFRDEDAEFLGRQPSRIIGRLSDKAQELNAMTDSDIKEIEKNSASGQSEDSGSV